MRLVSIRHSRAAWTCSRLLSSCHGRLPESVCPMPLIFDGVLSDETRAILTSADVFDTGPDVYRRVGGPVSPQDMIIESIIQGLQLITSNEIEWWGWTQWQPVEAHRDVDEEAAAVRGQRRFPTHTVLLYLNIEPDLRAPTCIWVPLRHSAEVVHGGSPSCGLVIVPAVSGRLVVFEGSLLHAVPRPTLEWLSLAPKGGLGAKEHTIRDRNVMVLNLWSDRAPADEPRPDDESDDELDDADEERNSAQLEPMIAPVVACEDRKNWLEVNIERNNLAISAETCMMHTLSHGSDIPLRTRVFADSADVAEAFKSALHPTWLWAHAGINDHGVGVPSVAGARAERGYSR